MNGHPLTSAAAQVDPGTDRIEVEGEHAAASEKHVYVKLNKPRGVVSTTSDDQGRETVLDLLPDRYKRMRLYPVGRLDVDTSGLVLLTNDGELANRLTHPRFEVEKEYFALIDEPLTDGQQRALERGVLVLRRQTAPAKVKRLVARAEPWYSITIHEGRKRQVRYMFRAVERAVRELRRVRIHTLELGRLAPGKTAEVTQKEMELLVQNLPQAAKKRPQPRTIPWRKRS